MSDTLALPHAFTTENARLMAQRSWDIRRKRAAEQPASEPAPAPATQPSEQPDDYTANQLSRVRAHLERLDVLLEDADDAQEIERLARARCALAELERILDGRPLPGSRRPGKERLSAPAMLTPG